MLTPPPGRNLSLDFLRGIAILCVLDYHFAPDAHSHIAASVFYYPLRWLGIEHFGWMGVDVFFVLSGFLVGGLLVKEWKLRGNIHARGFLLRRALKIWPQYYLFLAVMVLFHPHHVASMTGNFLNIQNYTGTPFPHTWSLAVEEHFYLLLAFFVALAAARATRPRTLFFIVATVAVLVSVFRFWRLLHGADDVYATHMRVDGLLWGVLLAILYHWAPERFARLQQRWWLWMIVLGVCIAVLCTSGNALGQAAGIGCADWAGVALLLLIYRPQEQSRCWPYRLVAWIGFYSYAIYLWHESVFGLVAAVTTRLPYYPLRVAVEAVAPWALAIGFGVVTTRLIEIPALRMRDRFFPRPIDSAIDPAARTLKRPTVSSGTVPASW